MRTLLWAVLAMGLASVAAGDDEPAQAPPFTPTASYEVRSIRGWTVRVNPELLQKEPALATQVLTLLESKLIEIAHMLPVAAVTRLREVPVWVELEEPRHPCMCYHVSPDWLREHGMNPDKARAVEIAGARNFLSWSRQQPSMVLHELAHGYHHRFLEDGYGNQAIRQTLTRARDEQLYERVLHWDGHSTRAYALNNPMEYFAESTEAYFGTNDFYPFVRAELKKHDPRMAQLLRTLWNPPPLGDPASEAVTGMRDLDAAGEAGSAPGSSATSPDERDPGNR